DRAEPRRVDALRLGDPRRAGDRRAAGGGGPSVRRPQSRALAAHLGHRRPLPGDGLRARTGRLRRRAGAAARAPVRGRRVIDGAAAREEERRIASLAGALAQREVDALLVGTHVNVRYLTGFTGSNGLALIAAAPAAAAARAGGHRFFTDFRYTTQSSEQVAPSLAREIVAGSLMEAAVRGLEGGGGTLGFDDASVTVAEHERLRAALPAGWTLQGCGGVVEGLRAVKDAGEIE